MQEFARVFGEGLANKVTLYIPSTTDVDSKLSEDAAAEVVNRAARLLADRFGGATAVPAQGAWVAESGKLVVERITLVYAFSGKLTTDDLESIKLFCEALKVELKQEAIAVEINGVLAFV